MVLEEYLPSGNTPSSKGNPTTKGEDFLPSRGPSRWRAPCPRAAFASAAAAQLLPPLDRSENPVPFELETLLYHYHNHQYRHQTPAFHSCLLRHDGCPLTPPPGSRAPAAPLPQKPSREDLGDPHQNPRLDEQAAIGNPAQRRAPRAGRSARRAPAGHAVKHPQRQQQRRATPKLS